MHRVNGTEDGGEDRVAKKRLEYVNQKVEDVRFRGYVKMKVLVKNRDASMVLDQNRDAQRATTNRLKE